MASQFSFFTVAAVEPAVLKDLKIDENGEPMRRRQQHRKSRNGCANCKKRKVKCDETQPSCLNCKKRGFDCNIPRTYKPKRRSPTKDETLSKESPPTDSSQSTPPTIPSQEISLSIDSTTPLSPQPWTVFAQSLFTSPATGYPFFSPFEDVHYFAQSPRHQLSTQSFCAATLFSIDSNSDCNSSYADTPYVSSPSINAPSTISSNVDLILRHSLADRELIQHFEDVTSKKLTMSSTIWGSKVLHAAMHEEYLMSGVLLIAAAHINYHLPKHSPHRRPLLHHFGNALSGLRAALNDELTLKILDDIISCSLLLMQYSWVYMEISPLDSLNIADMFCDTVLLFNGLKSCIVASHGLFVFRESAWAGVLGYSPRVSLEEYNRIHKFRERPFFKKIHHHTFCGLGTHDAECCSSDNVTAMQRLSIVLCAIEIAGDGLEESGVADDVYRYLMTWPPFCTATFLQQLRDNNPTSLCILLYYFAAIVRVSCDRIWWMRDRALYMYTLLKQRLEGRCELCTGPAVEFVGDADKGMVACKEMTTLSAISLGSEFVGIGMDQGGHTQISFI